jgi:hypothetical protein
LANDAMPHWIGDFATEADADEIVRQLQDDLASSWGHLPARDDDGTWARLSALTTRAGVAAASVEGVLDVWQGHGIGQERRATGSYYLPISDSGAGVGKRSAMVGNLCIQTTALRHADELLSIASDVAASWSVALTESPS